MSYLRKIKSITQSGIASVFNILMSMVRVKFVAIFLGPSGVAIIGQLTSLISISGIVTTLGMQNGVINEVTHARSNNDPKLGDQFKRTFFLVNVWLSFLIAALFFIFAKEISEWVFNSKENLKYIRITCVYICTGGLVSSYMTFLSSYKLVKPLMYVSIISSFASVTFTVFLIYFFSIDGAVISLSFNMIINLIITMIFLRRNNLKSYVTDIFSWKFINKTRLYTLLKYGGLLLASSLIYQLTSLELKNLIISKDGLSSAGYYQAAISISKQYMPIFISSLSVYLLPHISEQRSISAKSKELNAIVRILLIMITPTLIILSTFNELAIGLFYTSEFSTTASLLSMLIVSDYIGLLNKVYYTLAISLKRLKFLFLIDVALAAFMYLFSYLFYQQFGLTSIIYAHILASVAYFIISSIYLKKIATFVLSKANMILMLCSTVILAFLAFPIDQLIVRILVSIVYLIIAFSLFIRKSEWLAVKNKILSYTQTKR